MMGNSVHIPVLAKEVIDWLDPQPGQIFADGTLGGGGHTRLLAERVSPGGRVIALDRDPAALARAEQELGGLPVTISQSNFCELPEVLAAAGVEMVDGILLDLGLSSDQLADDERGFSFEGEGPLDLRFDTSRGEPAWRLLARMQEKTLADLIYELGEERHSRRVAREIVQRRETAPVRTARDLAEVARKCVPRSPTGEKIHPATRTFQALRIAVNEELKSLEIALRRLPDCLRGGPGGSPVLNRSGDGTGETPVPPRAGRLAIISFHSLEDRRVKEAFRDDARLKVLTRKPVRPSEAEVEANSRSRSAKLRVAERQW
jgi:16S rRNA (cytosine1402-N4)-methyltransferase